MNEIPRSSSARSGLRTWQWACFAFLVVFFFHLIWIWQSFDMTDEGFNLTNQWLIINGSGYYNWSGFNSTIWLSDLAGGVWLKIIGNLGLIGARLGWALLMGTTGLASFLILKRYFHPLSSLLAVLAVALASMYHSTMTINYNNFPALLMIGATGLLLASQGREASRYRQVLFAILGGCLLGLGVMARFPLVLSLFLPFVPPIVQALLMRRMPYKSSLIKALVSLGSAILIVLVCLAFLHLTKHLTEYWEAINNALFGAASSSSHAPVNLLHLYYRTGKSAMLWGIKFLFAGSTIILGLIAISHIIARISSRAARIRAIGAILLIIGMLLVIASFTILTPSFIARHLSPDGILGNATLLRIQTTRTGTMIGGGLLALLGVAFLIFLWFSRKFGNYFSKTRINWYWIPVILFGFLFFGLVQQQAGGRYEYSLALPGICFLLGTALVLLGVFSRRWLTAERLNRFVLLGMGFSVAVLSFIGSNNGISSAKNGLWLLFPAAFLLVPESLGKGLPSISSLAKRTKQKTLSNQFKQSVTYFVVAAMCAFALVGFHIRVNNPYRDLTNRSQLTTRVKHERLRGIFTSSGRAESVNQLLDEVDRLVKPRDIVLAYSAIPMIHYITETLPALGHPWPTLMQPSELEEQLNGLCCGSESLPQFVIRTRTDTANRIWGTRAIAPPQAPLRRVKDICILDGWIQEQGYREVWANRDFAIYKRLPEASSTSNIAPSLVDRERNGE